MGEGYLRVHTTIADRARPVPGVTVQIMTTDGQLIQRLITDSMGFTPEIALPAPPATETLHYQASPPYAVYDVMAASPGYEGEIIHKIHIVDTVHGELPINMIPIAGNDPVVHEITNEEHWLLHANTTDPAVEADASTPPAPGSPAQNAPPLPDIPASANPRASIPNPVQADYVLTAQVQPDLLPNVTIPDFITVHLGQMNSPARDIRVPFKDYIKNIASNEIYDTWHEEAIKANIYAIVSFTLNRLYTEFYRSRGYPFDITATTHMDHQFSEGTVFGANISRIVDHYFNDYIRMIGHKEPFHAMYCDGVKVQCPGQMTQWGSQDLAGQGMSAQEIIRFFYNRYDLEFVETNLVSNQMDSWPGYTIQQGYSGNIVYRMQDMINRIASSIGTPLITQVDGIYGPQTTAAVTAIQRYSKLTPDGKVGKATWHEIQRLYAAVRKLSQMDSEGDYVTIGRTPPVTSLSTSQRGELVARLQFLLNFISLYDPYVKRVLTTGIIDTQTRASVSDFQRSEGIPVDGSVGPTTWRALYTIYWGIKDHNIMTPPGTGGGGSGGGGSTGDGNFNIPSYPGYVLRRGSSGTSVRTLQQTLNEISKVISQIPTVGAVDGIFGAATEAAVRKFQQLWGLTVDGLVGPATWRAIMVEYADEQASHPPYPGQVIEPGMTNNNVKTLQNLINKVAATDPDIPFVIADGIFGMGTQNAVRTFQQQYGLLVDGRVGPSTWQAMVNVAYH